MCCMIRRLWYRSVIFIYTVLCNSFELVDGLHMLIFIWFMGHESWQLNSSLGWLFHFWPLTSIWPLFRLLEFGRHTRSFWFIIGSCLSIKTPFFDFCLSGLNIFQPIFWQRSSSHLQRISTGSWNKEKLNFPEFDESKVSGYKWRIPCQFRRFGAGWSSLELVGFREFWVGLG